MIVFSLCVFVLFTKNAKVLAEKGLNGFKGHKDDTLPWYDASQSRNDTSIKCAKSLFCKDLFEAIPRTRILGSIRSLHPCL